MLRQVAHPGIVQLLSTEGADPVDTLVLRTVGGGDLTTLGPEPMPVIAGLGAAVATTMADLHALGYCHGGIEASHVLLDEAGRPVLCSLGRATATAPDADRQHHDDLRALAVMLLQLIPPGGSGRVSRMLRGLATPGRRRPRRDASWLARHLMSMVPDARLPGPDRAGGPAPAVRVRGRRPAGSSGRAASANHGRSHGPAGGRRGGALPSRGRCGRTGRPERNVRPVAPGPGLGPVACPGPGPCRGALPGCGPRLRPDPVARRGGGRPGGSLRLGPAGRCRCDGTLGLRSNCVSGRVASGPGRRMDLRFLGHVR